MNQAQPATLSYSGKCFCGACSFVTTGKPNWVGTCHCESCRRNCAAPFTTFFGINNDQWQWSGNHPAILHSSAGVSRYFCTDCGTPMAYHNEKWAHETHFYVASLDDPSQLPPTFHVHWDERLAWISIDDNLPKYAGSADGNAPIKGSAD